MKKTITIGISAYNEERNILALLRSIQKQHIVSGTICEIIVISDGSSDRTVERVKQASIQSLIIIDSKERCGVNARLNQIFQLAKGDILVILNADVVIKDAFFIENLITPFLTTPNIGLVSGDVVGLPPRTFFEKVIVTSHELKMAIGKLIQQSNNVYMCYGGNRAFSKVFYKTLHIPDGYPDDAFTYFSCLKRKLRFFFQDDAKILIRLPASLKDHRRQSSRFNAGKKKLEKYFGVPLVKSSYAISGRLLVPLLLLYFCKNPLGMILYLGINLWIRVVQGNASFQTKWEIVESTKNI